MKSQEVLAALPITITCTHLTMPGFLSLSIELIEHVGELVISEQRGLKRWCRVASTCKTLWEMPLPGSARTWAMDLDVNVEGMSKVHVVLLMQSNATCMCP